MDHVSHLVTTYGYVLIFILVFLDQAAISIPSPPFVTAMGVLASRGQFNIWFAFLVVLAAAMVPDCLWFRIGLSTVKAPSANPLQAVERTLSQRSPILSDEASSARYSAVKFSLLPSALVPFAAGSTRLPAPTVSVYGRGR